LKRPAFRGFYIALYRHPASFSRKYRNSVSTCLEHTANSGILPRILLLLNVGRWGVGPKQRVAEKCVPDI
jgi:hypothetical protein